MWHLSMHLLQIAKLVMFQSMNKQKKAELFTLALLQLFWQLTVVVWKHSIKVESPFNTFQTSFYNEKKK